MNPSLERVQDQNRKPGLRERLPQALFCMVLVMVALVSTVLVNGCKKTSRTGGTTEPTAAKVNPWEQVAKKLKKDTDFVTCQNALRILVENLRNDESLPKPAILGAQQESDLSAVVPLNAADREEIHNWNYSAHDPAYLADCLLMRDAAQSLKVPNLTSEQCADIGFAWVCRSVALQSMPVGDKKGSIAAALPPTSVLRRGYGSALERMYVFLSLLQQMDLDVCLIGPPGARDVGEWSAFASDRTTLFPGGPSRPFWGVGVRLGADIKLYDPWRGEAFPALFNALKANPEAHNKWFESPMNLSGLKPGDIKNARLYLAVPVNSLSPRMEMLHQKMSKEGLGVRLSINPTSLQANFPDPKPTFWNPPEDRFAYGRASRTFLPRELGGTDDGQGQIRIYDFYIQVQIPTGFKTTLSEFQGIDTKEAGDATSRLSDWTRQIYRGSFITVPNPRERIVRGHFQEAIRDLIEKRDIFDKSLDAVRYTPDVEEQIRNWCFTAKDLYQKLGRTAIIDDKVEKATRLAELQAAIDTHWRDPAALIMISRVSSPICKLEVSFLIALCKHEEAERAQTEADYVKGEDAAGKQKAKEAWINARNYWRNYFEGFNSIQENIPGRAMQARTLSSRAEKLAESK